MELKRTRTQLEVANGDKRRVETQRLALQAELHVLQDKAARWHELEFHLRRLPSPPVPPLAPLPAAKS